MKVVGHYLPVWIPMILILVRWASIGGWRPTAAGADVAFASLTFWIWAMTTNGHGNRLAASSGRRKGTVDQRSDEFVLILGGFFVSLLLYLLACSLVQYGLVFALMGIVASLLFLESTPQ